MYIFQKELWLLLKAILSFEDNSHNNAMVLHYILVNWSFSLIAGKEIRNKNYYEQYVDLRNKAARMNGFRDGTESQIHAYESKTFVQEMAETWNGLKVCLLLLL